MSIFGSLNSAITPDYFGDEFGLPLPQCSMVKNRATAQPNGESGNSRVTNVVIDKIKNGFVNCMRVAEARESTPRAPAALAIAPVFDGLHCFETFVFSRNLK